MKVKASAPCRISLVGGGTDLPFYANKYGGCVLSMAISLRSHVELFEKGKEESSIYHHFPAQTDPKLAYKTLQTYKVNDLIINSSSDCHIGSGLGTSSAFLVSLISAIEKSRGSELKSKELAEKAFHIEHLVKNVGRQDIYAAVYGGMNYIYFSPEGEVYPQNKEFAKFLHPYMVLLYIGGNRESGKVQLQSSIMKKKFQFDSLDITKKLVSEAIEAIDSKDIEHFSIILNKAWEMKKMSNELVSNEFIDELYDKGIKNGALAGKLLGAGQGGHFLFIVEPKKRTQFVKSMGFEEVKFEIDYKGVEVSRLEQ